MTWMGRAWSRARRLFAAPDRLESRLERVALALGRIESRQLGQRPPRTLHEAEFSVFSQWGEDGIIDWLTRVVPIERRIFAELGVEDYREANSRFLLECRGWAGLVVDSNAEHVARIVGNDSYWRHNLKARSAFVTAENINPLLLESGLEGDIGLLSIDIDGNDYWLWRAIEVVSPRIVVIEYNALFGPSARVSVPYEAGFRRGAAHYSNLYFGASLGALDHLGSAKGYALVGCNSTGCNAFFVRKDISGTVATQTPAEAYMAPDFRQSRDRKGRLTHLSVEESLNEIQELPLVDVVSGETCSVAEAVRISP